MVFHRTIKYVKEVVGTKSDTMGTDHRDMTLTVDDRGRVTLPKEVREQLGIEANDQLTATLEGGVLEVVAKPSRELVTASAKRDDWRGSTPTDAGESLFGPLDR